MKNILSKLSLKSGPNTSIIGRTFSADEIKPIFKQYNFDIDKGVDENKFPGIEYRNDQSPQMAFDVRFSNVAIIPVKVNGEMSTIITGEYFAQAHESAFPGAFGDPQRAEPIYGDFKIQDGKLNFKVKN